MKKILIFSILAILLATAGVKAQDNGLIQLGGFTIYCPAAANSPFQGPDDYYGIVVGFPANAVINNLPSQATYKMLEAYPGHVPAEIEVTVPVLEIDLRPWNNDTATVQTWQEITVPNFIRKFGHRDVFEYATALRSVDLSATSLTKVGARTFTGCASLQNVSLPATLTEIGGSEFNGCASLQNIAVPAAVKKIGSSAFYGCTSLNTADLLGDSLDIGSLCFYGCTNLQHVNFLPNIQLKLNNDNILHYDESESWSTNTGTYYVHRSWGIFEGCTSLTSITLPEGLETLPSTSFYDCTGLTSITLPHSLKTVGYQAFKNCTALQSVTFTGPDSLSIGSKTFKNCTALTSVDFDNPNALKIGDYAFSDCTGLTSFTVPEGTYEISNSAPFYRCTNLKTLYYNVPNLNYQGGRDYENPLFGFTNVKPSLENLYLGSRVETIPQYFFSHLNIQELNLPESVTKIGKYAFYRCDSLKTVTIPETVVEVGDYAFYVCNSLKEVNIRGQLTGKGIFSWCDALEKVIFSETLDSIPESVFLSDDSLKIITIPQSVTHIGNSAFAYLPHLQQVRVNWQTPIDIVKELDYQAVFYNYSYNDFISNVTLIVPRGTKELYKVAPVWQDFKIEEDATGINEITNYKLKITIVGDELRLINLLGFKNLTGLADVAIYDVAGRNVGAGRALPLHNGAQGINISHLPSGVYIVRVGNQSAKFIKK
ncbi:hypothetical protein AGMMS50262_17790 [Bacteroidia bacterium]|nr:hypothetical protein AGMMS50262_17790 [Bacteroidia bacterium]